MKAQISSSRCNSIEDVKLEYLKHTPQHIWARCVRITPKRIGQNKGQVCICFSSAYVSSETRRGITLSKVCNVGTTHFSLDFMGQRQISFDDNYFNPAKSIRGMMCVGSGLQYFRYSVNWAKMTMHNTGTETGWWLNETGHAYEGKKRSRDELDEIKDMHRWAGKLITSNLRHTLEITVSRLCEAMLAMCPTSAHQHNMLKQGICPTVMSQLPEKVKRLLCI